MGKGDKKSKKGKRFKHSHGKTRPQKKGRLLSSRKKFEAKTKPVEHKKPTKPEVEKEEPAVVLANKDEDINIKEPVITEIKEEVKIPEVKEEPVSNIPDIVKEPIREETEKVETEKVASKTESKKEEPTKTPPKKRGRPKKKKE
jgi:ribosomal small subunit protein bTHX